MYQTLIVKIRVIFNKSYWLTILHCLKHNIQFDFNHQVITLVTSDETTCMCSCSKEGKDVIKYFEKIKNKKNFKR